MKAVLMVSLVVGILGLCSCSTLNHKPQPMHGQVQSDEELLTFERALSKSLQTQCEQLQKDLESQQFLLKHYKAIDTGIGAKAMIANFGRFFLIKREGEHIAFRILKHVGYEDDKPYHSSNFSGMEYEYYRMPAPTWGLERTSGVVREPNAFIDFGGFRVEWSKSDWLHFPDNLTAFSNTEWVDIGDVDFDYEKLLWYYLRDVESDRH